MTVERLMDILKESKYTVVLSGNGMVLESDYMLIRDSQESYDIEKKYRYSAEELFSSSLFSTRKELFYEFYRNEMLPQLEKPPGEGFYALAALEKKGLIDTVITRRVYHLPTRAGCKNVIELHGNICEHYCPHCGEEYSLDYIRQSRRVPLCTKCNTALRPRAVLYGEMVDNQVKTKAAEEVMRADVVLALGTNLKTTLCEQLLGYYGGNRLILITLKEHFSDKYADGVIHDRVDQTLLKILCQSENLHKLY